MRSLHPHTPQLSLAGLLLLCSFQLRFTTAGFTQCYYPDGSIPNDYVWVPCTGAQFSSCCIPSEGDVCQDNGLCFYPNNNHTFRGTCTDRTWNDPACPKDVCVTGSEDTWQWVSSCSSNGGSSSFVCGKISEEDGGHKTANCSAGATEFTNFRTEPTSTSKPTRYTPPPTLDPLLYTVFTSEYTTVITATVQDTTVTTTWESTITSTLSHSGSSSRSATGIAAGITSGGSSSSVPTSLSSSNNGKNNKGKVTISAGVLAGAIAGPVILLALLAGLFFFLRKRRALNKDGGLHAPLDSSASPPPNGPVGAHQVTPYEVPASEAKFQPGSGLGEKHVYTGTTTRRNDEGYYSPNPNENTYEMGVGVGAGGGVAGQNEKGWHGHGNPAHVAEVEGDISRPGTAVPLPPPSPSHQQQQQQYQQQYQPQQQYPQSPQQQQQQNQNQQYYQAYSPGQQNLHPGSGGGVRSPAPVYSENNGPVVMPVELDGTGSMRGASAGAGR